MFEVRDKPEMVERALLIRIYSDKREEEEAISLLEELGELVKTLGIGVIESCLVHTRSLHRKFLCGTGKAQEMVDLAKAHECDCIVFDNMFLPSQQRNWEELADTCVIDREEVILDIFSQRAQTREARLQVDLAKMQYSLPRLTRMWGHLDREGGGGGDGGGSGGGKGGGGASRGMGEQQVEVDRRLARTRIDQCKRELAEVRKQRGTRRKEREKQGVPCAAIAGYTNAGKSTLLNCLSGSDIMAKDMLFATLDTTTRAIELPDGQPLLLTDTVGFVRNLPHRLVEAFKATLEESVLADFIIHVLDASSPEVEKYYETTMEVLEELGAGDKPVITVLNKIDVLNDPVKLAGLEVTFPNTISVSAITGKGCDELLVRCSEMLADRVSTQTYRIPQSRGDLSGLLHRDAKVLETEYDGNDIIVKAVVPASIAGKLASYKAS
jgi:GTP-binding protein HflX